jgi:WD40 repeat protein
LDRFWRGWDTESQIDIQPRKNYNLFSIDIPLSPHPLAVMNKLKLLKLAKQGNCEAISMLLNRQLRTKEIVVKVFIKQGCLNIIIESNTVPNQESWGKVISKLIDNLGLTFIEQVKVSAKKAGEDIIEWSQTFELIQKSKVDHVFFRDTLFNNPLKQLEKIGEKANQKINQSVDEITNTFSETSQNLVGKITDTSNQIQEITSKNLDQTVQKISEVQTTASQSIIETVDEITNTFSQTYQNLSEKITDTSNQIQETTSKNLDQVVKNTASILKSFLSKWGIDKNTPVLPYGFFAVAFINEGKTLICSKGDGSVIFWNWLNSKVVKIDDKQQNFVEFRCHKKTITAFDVSLNEKFLVTSSENEPIKLWDIINRKIICTFGEQSNLVQVIKFSPNSELLASSEADNQIKIWDIKSQLEIKNLSSDVNSIRCLCFSENGKFLAGASDDGSIKIWNLSTGKIVSRFPGHNGGTHCILFNSKKQILISGGHDCLIKIWDVKTGDLIYQMNGHEAAISCLAISSDQKNLVSGSFDQTIKIWNFNKKKMISTINNHSKVITSLAFSPTNKILASSSIDESVKVWDINFLNNKSKLWIKFYVGILFSVIVFSFNVFISNNNNENQCLNFLLECINQTSYGTALILVLNITFILSIFISLTILFTIYSSPLRAILSVVKIPVFMKIVELIQMFRFLFLD